MVRRAMSKKKAKDVEREREAFLHGDPTRNIRGCVANGIPEATAQAIYDEIYDFANYAFNKAHAVSYAVVAYQTAYFKHYFTREYMAALLTSVLDNSDKVAEYIAECRDCGIELLPPDVNRSSDGFTVEDGGIRFGLVAIKNIGRGFIQTMMRRREQDGPFRSFQDFCQRMFDCTDMNKRAVENLIRSGAFDSMKVRRSQLIQVFEKVLDSIAESRRKNVEGQLDLFGMAAGEDAPPAETPLPDIPEFTAAERMFMEKETTGLYLSGHPMADYRALARQAGAVPIHTILEDFSAEDGPVRFADGQSITIAGIVTASRTRTTRNNALMAYVTVEDEAASIELLCFSRTIERCGSYMQVNSPVLVQGKLSVRDEKPPQIMCDSVYPLKEGLPPRRENRRPAQENATIYLRVPGMDSPAFQHIKLVMTMFEGDTPLKIRLADNGKLLVHYETAEHEPCVLNTMHLKNPITADSFKIHAPAGAKKVKALVMDTLPYMPFTNRRDVELPVVDGVVQCDVEQDVLYIAQVERHGKNGNVGKAFMGGFHIRGGAMASSVGHDNHNIIVMGDSFEDMALAVNRCVELGGGQVIVRDGKVAAEVAYPICGLLSDLPLEELAEKKKELNRVAHEMGTEIAIPFMFLSFICLAAIPAYAITDCGFIDVVQQKVIDPILEVVE